MACLSVLLLASSAPKSAYYVPFIFLLLAGGCALLRANLRAKAALVLLVACPFPWLANASLEWLARASAANELQARRDYAESIGVPFDARAPIEIVEDLRRAGRDVWPAVYPGPLAADPGGLLTEGGETLLPLAGIANVDTRYGNEDGRYLIYRSDEHGFHNPLGIWELPQIDVAAVGDSYTHGAQVPSDRNLIAPVRQRWPNTLNLGFGSNGPLVELATLLEYLPQRRPRVVLWVLCELNDVGEDLNRELQSPLLQRYRKERRGLQNLEARQPEIDALLRDYAERAMLDAHQPQVGSLLWSLATLERLRVSVREVVSRPPDRWDVLAEILRTAKDEVGGWQGTLYLVYLPLQRSLPESRLMQFRRGDAGERRERVLEMGKVLDIPVIDIETAFDQAGPRAKTFYYPYPAHFTAAGYDEAGRAIAKRLQADGF